MGTVIIILFFDDGKRKINSRITGKRLKSCKIEIKIEKRYPGET